MVEYVKADSQMKGQSSNFIHAKKSLKYVQHRPLKILIGGAGKMGADAEAFEMLLKNDYSIVGVDISPDVGRGSKQANRLHAGRPDGSSLRKTLLTFALALQTFTRHTWSAEIIRC